jgi:hypothetical protein
LHHSLRITQPETPQLRGFPPPCQEPWNGRDVRSLEHHGLIRFIGPACFELTEAAFGAYGKLAVARGEPVERVESDIMSYIRADAFAKRHSTASAKLAPAEGLLRSANAQEELTAIGHHCREALQGFADRLAGVAAIDVSHAPKASFVQRLRAIIQPREAALGSSRSDLLVRLIEPWDAVRALVQRQVHGAQGERHSLSWEDARRVVFHTMIVMYEIDRELMSGSRDGAAET